jgi:hypothetical protein
LSYGKCYYRTVRRNSGRIQQVFDRIPSEIPKLVRLPTVLVRVLEYLCVMKTAENEIRPARQALHGSNVPLLQCSFAVLSRAVADLWRAAALLFAQKNSF